MKWIRWAQALLFITTILALTASGCRPVDGGQTGLPTQPETTTQPSLPAPGVFITVIPTLTPRPSPDVTANAYLSAWQQDAYETMYNLLTSESQAAITLEDFTKRYLEVAANAAVDVGKVDYTINQVSDTAEGTRVDYQITLHSTLFGDIVRSTAMELRQQGGEWQVVWNETLILPELAGGSKLVLLNDLPVRGNVYDRNGSMLIGPSGASSIGINPSLVNPDQEKDMLSALERVTGLPSEYTITLYKNYGNADTYIPITDVPQGTNLSGISGYDAILVYSFSGRYYFNREAGSQALGYISAIQPEEVIPYQRRGYQWTERVPRTGVELWGEPWLGGKRGGTLYVYDANNQPLNVIANAQKSPSYDVYTTLDRDLQVAAQRALFGLSGAIVVLEKDTGRVLAMASSPGFNPNLFEPTNYNAIFDSPFFTPNAPLFNRASQGQYPLGSVFKIITLAAALESGRFTKESTYQCEHAFTEVSGVTLYDWTYWDEIDPSGLLTLPQGLMRSCNPWFWHIAVDLYNAGLAGQISEMAKGFGLGSPTGIEQVSERPGQIPVPNELLAATNLAIGQGEVLVTPLQVARFVAAIGNGGTLYLPQMVEKVQNAEGEIAYEFKPQAMGTLPVSPETLQTLQEAMRSVVNDRRGTAYRILGAFGYNLAGKTSTSETGVFDPDAWFVAYSDANLPDKPDIAIVAMVEKVGEGSDYAAPIVRRVLEVYFYGNIRTRYPWEVRVGVPEFIVPTPTPTPELPPTITPQPEFTPTP